MVMGNDVGEEFCLKRLPLALLLAMTVGVYILRLKPQNDKTTCHSERSEESPNAKRFTKQDCHT